MKTRTRRFPIYGGKLKWLLLAAGASLTACGGSDNPPPTTATAPSPTPTATPAEKCNSLPTLSLKDTSITSAAVVPAGDFVPPDWWESPSVNIPFSFCRVKGTLTPTSDSNIKFEVWLPLNNWNGKLNHSGNGGLAGDWTSNTGFMVQALLKGYATTGTDLGHIGSFGDASWALGHPEKVVDYGYRGNHVTSVAAKSIINAFYGKAPDKSYFTGCSDGGREALMEAQRYPDDYDGIVAGAPANFWMGMSAAWVWNARAMLDDPAGTIPAEKISLIHNAAVSACPGAVAGFIDDPMACKFDPGTLLCTGADSSTCLTAPQVATVRKIYAGPSNPRTGEQIFAGAERGSEVQSLNNVGPFLGGQTYQYMAFENPNWDYRSFNFDSDVAFSNTKLSPILDATNPDLSAFNAAGHKLLMYHGWEDGGVYPQTSVKYFNSVVALEQSGSATSSAAISRAQNYVRLFMVPGMQHCHGGDGLNTFDTLTAIEKWVEQGIAPDQILASHTALGYAENVSTYKAGDFSRPLCAYPKQAVWNGQGSAKDAANYVCR